MSDRGKFLIFCIEQYRANKGLSGREVIMLFNEYGVADYIYDCFGALHTTGTVQYKKSEIYPCRSSIPPQAAQSFLFHVPAYKH